MRSALVRGLKAAGAHDVAREMNRCSAQTLPGVQILEFTPSPAGGLRPRGLMPCGRVTCPICGPRLAAVRAGAYSGRLEGLYEEGRHFHATLTLQHSFEDAWSVLAGHLKAAFKAAQGTRKWKEAVLGFFRMTHTTWSRRSGHHLHLHLILTLRPDADLEAFARWLEGFWASALKRRGRDASWKSTGGAWWKALPGPMDLSRAFHYVASHPVPRVWKGSPLAFAELWHTSKHHRWQGTGGVWRLPSCRERRKAPREAAGRPVAASVSAEAWSQLTLGERSRLLKDLACPGASLEPFAAPDSALNLAPDAGRTEAPVRIQGGGFPTHKKGGQLGGPPSDPAKEAAALPAPGLRRDGGGFPTPTTGGRPGHRGACSGTLSKRFGNPSERVSGPVRAGPSLRPDAEDPLNALARGGQARRGRISSGQSFLTFPTAGPTSWASIQSSGQGRRRACRSPGGVARSSQAPTASGPRMTGIRAWSSSMAALADVVMTVKVRRSPFVAPRPANHQRPPPRGG